MPTLSTRRWPPYPVSDRAILLALKPLVFLVSLWPAASVLLAALTHRLDINPFNAIVRSTGFWSLRFLCLTLAITPFRWLTGWHSVVKSHCALAGPTHDGRSANGSHPSARTKT